MVYIIKGDTIYHGEKAMKYPGKGDGIHGDSSW